ncbi:MAG: DUF4282 domain-containing protein [Desulfurivibrio sp.]|nr:DUF4282 domain-containing protein [Desulfurivibrio sp.]
MADEKSMVNEIFFFDSMLTPKIITVVYWLFLLSSVLGGLGLMLGSNSVVGGLGMIVFGCVGARIWCELLIVLFKIHENIKRLVDGQTGREQATDNDPKRV